MPKRAEESMIGIYVSKDLHDEIKTEAKNKELSITKYLINLHSQSVGNLSPLEKDVRAIKDNVNQIKLKVDRISILRKFIQGGFDYLAFGVLVSFVLFILMGYMFIRFENIQ